MMPPANFDGTHLCDFEHHHKYLDPLSISGLSASPHASKAACMTSERLRAHATDDPYVVRHVLCALCGLLSYTVANSGAPPRIAVRAS
jgi:hypothetical protein